MYKCFNGNKNNFIVIVIHTYMCVYVCLCACVGYLGFASLSTSEVTSRRTASAWVSG